MYEDFDYPELTVWVTSVGRIDLLPDTIESFIKHCTYPNYRMIIIESQMTDISKQFFALEYINNEATAEYLKTLQERFPNVKMEIIVQPYKPLGEEYNQLLEKSGPYYLNIEDDLPTVCDPHDQIMDAIRLHRVVSKLFGVRIDLRDETWFEFCPRYPHVGYALGMKYVWLDFCSGGAQIMDTNKVRANGDFATGHKPEDYGHPERTQSASMVKNGMHTCMNLKYWGFLKHMGHHGILGGDRTWTNRIYSDLEKHGWYGDGTKRIPMPHPRDWYIATRINNGRL